MNDVLAALATPRRRAILRLLWQGELSAGDIHHHFDDVTFGAVSQHLGVLARAGLVTRRADGRRRLYRACKDELGPLRIWLESMWATALDELATRAEFEAARRGPRPRTRTRTRRRRQRS